MKKFFLMAAIFALLFGFASCGGNGTQTSPTLTLDPASVTINNGNLSRTVEVGGTATGEVHLSKPSALPAAINAVFDPETGLITVTGTRPTTAYAEPIQGTFIIGVTRQNLTEELQVNVNLTTTWEAPPEINTFTIAEDQIVDLNTGFSSAALTYSLVWVDPPGAPAGAKVNFRAVTGEDAGTLTAGFSVNAATGVVTVDDEFVEGTVVVEGFITPAAGITGSTVSSNRVTITFVNKSEAMFAEAERVIYDITFVRRFRNDTGGIEIIGRSDAANYITFYAAGGVFMWLVGHNLPGNAATGWLPAQASFRVTVWRTEELAKEFEQVAADRTWSTWRYPATIGWLQGTHNFPSGHVLTLAQDDAVVRVGNVTVQGCHWTSWTIPLIVELGAPLIFGYNPISQPSVITNQVINDQIQAIADEFARHGFGSFLSMNQATPPGQPAVPMYFSSRRVLGGVDGEHNWNGNDFSIRVYGSNEWAQAALTAPPHTNPIQRSSLMDFTQVASSYAFGNFAFGGHQRMIDIAVEALRYHKTGVDNRVAPRVMLPALRRAEGFSIATNIHVNASLPNVTAAMMHDGPGFVRFSSQAVPAQANAAFNPAISYVIFSCDTVAAMFYNGLQLSAGHIKSRNGDIVIWGTSENVTAVQGLFQQPILTSLTVEFTGPGTAGIADINTLLGESFPLPLAVDMAGLNPGYNFAGWRFVGADGNPIMTGNPMNFATLAWPYSNQFPLGGSTLRLVAMWTSVP